MIAQMLRQCKRKLPRHPEYKCFPHWTFLVGTRTQNVISVGMNRRREPHKHLGYHNDPDPTFKPKWHAELDAICKSNNKELSKGFIAINVRLNKAGEPKLSRPCEACFTLLSSFGCRRIYFTTDNGLSYVDCN